jgi:hypothetical protein
MIGYAQECPLRGSIGSIGRCIGDVPKDLSRLASGDQAHRDSQQDCSHFPLQSAVYQVTRSANATVERHRDGRARTVA